MWIKYIDNGSTRLLNLSQTTKIEVQEKSIVFYGQPCLTKGKYQEEEFETIVDLLEFNSRDESEQCLLEIIDMMISGETIFEPKGYR